MEEAIGSQHETHTLKMIVHPGTTPWTVAQSPGEDSLRKATVKGRIPQAIGIGVGLEAVRVQMSGHLLCRQGDRIVPSIDGSRRCWPTHP